MIGRGVATGAVCLGCRLQNVRASKAPALYLYSRYRCAATARLFPATAQTRKWYSAEASAQKRGVDLSDEKEEAYDTGDHHQRPREPQQSSEEPESRRGTRESDSVVLQDQGQAKGFGDILKEADEPRTAGHTTALTEAREPQQSSEEPESRGGTRESDSVVLQDQGQAKGSDDVLKEADEPRTAGHNTALTEAREPQQSSEEPESRGGTRESDSVVLQDQGQAKGFGDILKEGNEPRTAGHTTALTEDCPVPEVSQESDLEAPREIKDSYGPHDPPRLTAPPPIDNFAALESAQESSLDMRQEKGNASPAVHRRHWRAERRPAREDVFSLPEDGSSWEPSPRSTRRNNEARGKKWEGGGRRKEQKGPVVWKKLDVPKKYYSNHDRLYTEGSRSLGENILGKPGSAIVMRDRGVKKKKFESITEEDENEKKEKTDLVSLLETQKKAPPPEEVRTSIDALRPELDRVAEKVFLKLFRELQEGFLRSQLKMYVLHWRKTHDATGKPLAGNVHRTWAETVAQTASDIDDDLLDEADSPDDDMGLACEGSRADERPSDEKPGFQVSEEEAADREVTEEHNPGDEGIADADSKTHDGTTASYAWLREVTPWTRLDTANDKRVYGAITRSANAKDRLVVRIMRECWGVRLETATTDLGEMIVRLRTHAFVLLLRGTRRFVHGFNEFLTEPGEVIEANRTQKFLRFVTSRPKADSLLAHVDEMLKGMTTKSLPLPHATGSTEALPEEVMEELGRLTSTSIRPSSTGRRLHVTCYEGTFYKDNYPDVEDMRNVVFRLLMTAYRKPRVKMTLYAPQEMPGHPKGRYLIDTFNGAKWDWKERMCRWGRYVLPKPLNIRGTTPAVEALAERDGLPDGLRDEQDEAKVEQDKAMDQQDKAMDQQDKAMDQHDKAKGSLPTKDFPLGTLQMPIRWPDEKDNPSTPYLLTEQKKTAFPYQPVRWSPSLSTTTTAIYGHILHSHLPHSLPPQELPVLLQACHPRILSPITPHPHSLARLEVNPNQSVRVTSTMLIRFVVAPSSDEALPAPPLELRLNYDEHGVHCPGSPAQVTGVHSLRAVKETHWHDVMLPSQSVDIRFVQSLYSTLHGTPTAIAAWQPITDFLSRSRLDVEDSQLEFPPTQAFAIPRRLFTDFHQAITKPNRTPKSIVRAKARLAKSKHLPAKALARHGLDLEASDPDTTVSVQYRYAGTELHRSTVVAHEGYTLTYTSISGGKSGGSRAQLSLEPVSIDGGDPLVNKSLMPLATAGNPDPSWVLHDDYLRTCYNLAHDQRFWTGPLGRSWSRLLNRDRRRDPLPR